MSLFSTPAVDSATATTLAAMKRLFAIPFLSALIGGGVVVAVLAASGSLSSSSKTVTEVQAAAPVSTSGTASSSAAIPTRSGGGGGLSAHEIYERTAPSVVKVTSTIVRQSESPFGFGESQQQGIATGSGFVIDSNGTILTNWHVVENASKVTVSFEHSKTVEAHVVGKNPSQDIAVLKIPTEGLTLHPLPLGDSERRRGRRTGRRDRQPLRPQPHPHHRRDLGAAARNHRPQRLLDRQRAADRRADQPRQLRRSAAQRQRAGDRHHLADRDRRRRQRRQHRDRLRGADQHRQGGAPRTREERLRPDRLPRRRDDPDRRLALEPQPARQKRRADRESRSRQPRRQGRASTPATSKRRSAATKSPSAATSSSGSTAKR